MCHELVFTVEDILVIMKDNFNGLNYILYHFILVSIIELHDTPHIFANKNISTHAHARNKAKQQHILVITLKNCHQTTDDDRIDDNNSNNNNP